LTDADARIRWSAAEALGRIGPDAEAAVPALAAALRDPEVRASAADALGGIGAAARGAVPLLTDALNDTDAEFRWTAAVALSRIDARSAQAALPLFIDKLKNGNHRARWDALQYIAPMGREAKAAAPAVRELVKHGNGVAAATLTAIAGPEAGDALPVLLRVLADDWDTTDDIARIGAAAVPELLTVLKDPEAKNRHLVVKALGLLASTSTAVIPALLEALKAPDRVVRRAAAAALGGIEPRAQEAIPGLREVLRDEEPSVRLAAAAALRAIQGPDAEPAVAALVPLLSHADANIRRDTAAALAEFGAAAKVAIPALDEAQRDADASVRSAAALAVARITAAEAHRGAITVMIAALKDKAPRARLDAARFLGSLGPHAGEAVPALVEARLDENEEVRRAAAEALTKIQGR
jgi:HEAT repeat protein